MLVYLGQTRGRNEAHHTALGFGEVTQPREMVARGGRIRPPRRRPWFLDNNAWGDWRRGREFDGGRFLLCCEWAAAQAGVDLPDLVVAPDLVAAGLDSLAFSLRWLGEHQARFAALRFYLAVQDGMEAADVAPVVRDLGLAGLFVGGSRPWKLGTAGAWARLARDLGVGCHTGRVSSYKRVAWARDLGMTSVDGTQALRQPHKLARIAAIAAAPPTQAHQVEIPGSRDAALVAPGVGEWEPPRRLEREESRQAELWPRP